MDSSDSRLRIPLATREEAPQPVVAGRPVHPPAGDGVPVIEVGQQPGNVGRVVLQIGVHREHPPAPGRAEAGIGGRGFPGVGLEPHQPDPRIAPEAADDLGAPVVAAVVDEHHLEAPAQPFQHRRSSAHNGSRLSSSL